MLFIHGQVNVVSIFLDIVIAKEFSYNVLTTFTIRVADLPVIWMWYNKTYENMIRIHDFLIPTQSL